MVLDPHQSRKLADVVKDGEIVVFIGTKDAQCNGCREPLPPGSFFTLDGKDVFCLACADLDALEYLPRGDAALTRRTTKHSPVKAVVIQWSRRRKRYERQGILAAPEAIARAEAECEADAPERAQRRASAAVVREAQDKAFVAAFGEAIRRTFPGCPPADTDRIAAHACEKHSGRVGRSAAAKDLDAETVRLAVRAHVRHEHTEYDRLMDAGVPKRDARARVAEKIGQVVARWGSAG